MINNELNLIPIFNERLANALTDEGYVIHHTDGNINNPEKTVFYFIDVPGIHEDMNRLSYKNRGNQKTNIPVFSFKLARRLINKGYILNHTNKNNNYPKLKIYFFRDAPGLKDEIAAYQREVAIKKEDRNTNARAKTKEEML